MAGIVTRRPFAGAAAGLIIGALGLLLTGIDAAPGVGRGIAGLLFKVAGYFFLFIAAMAFLASLSAFGKKNRSGNGNSGPLV